MMDETKFWIEVQFMSKGETSAEVLLGLQRAGYPVDKDRPEGQNHIWVLGSDYTVSGPGGYGLNLISPVLESSVGFYEVHCLLRSLAENENIRLNRKCRLLVHIDYTDKIFEIKASADYLRHPINALIDAFEQYEELYFSESEGAEKS